MLVEHDKLVGRAELLSLSDPANADLARLLGLTSVTDDLSLVRVSTLGELQDKGEDGQRPVLISTDDVDRMGDVVEPAGVDLSNFRKNPVILWAHDYSLPPIGNAMWVKRAEHGLLAKVRWAPTDFAQQIKTLYDEGFLRAWSVGFLVREWEPITEKVDGIPRETGRRFTKTELLEFSAVPVPANPEALSLAIAKGLRVSDDVRQMLLPPPTERTTTVVLGGDSASATLAAPPCDDCARTLKWSKVLEADRDDLKTRLASAQRDALDSETALQAEREQHAACRKELDDFKASDTRIRIYPEALQPDAARTVATVEGRTMTLAELKAAIADAVQVVMRRYTGELSR